MIIYINGKHVKKEKSHISIFDRGFLYGDGVFESFRTFYGTPFMLEEHLKRLSAAAKLISIKAPDLKNAVLKTIKANKFKESYIKVIITRGMAEKHGLDIKNVTTKPTIIIIVDKIKDLPAKTYIKGWTAVITKIKRGDTISNLKSLNYLNNIIAKTKTKANEAIFLTNNGYLAEGTVSNLFFVKGKTLFTPSLKTGILNGITRTLILKLAKKIGLKVNEGLFKKDRLYNSNEAFVSSSGPGILPIVKVDNKKIGEGKLGTITAELISEYNKLIRDQIR